jgi:pilus assembly protein CpaC
MASSTLTRTALVASLAVLAMGAVVSAAPREVRPAARAGVVDLVSSESNSVPIPLGVGKSVVIDLPRDIKDVLVADPKIANAVVRSARRAYLIGVAIGQTNVFFFDAEGKQIAGFDIAVKRDLNGLRAALQHLAPGGSIQIEGLGDGVMLTGSVATPGEAQQAVDLATRLVGGDEKKVLNNIIVRGRDQVLLKVTVAEVQRDVVKQLGIDFNGSLGFGTSVINFKSTNPFGVSGGALSDTALSPSFKNGSINATVRALERVGVIRTLAEPNLTAISGETATFIAGGEFPVPNGLSCDTTRSPPVCQQQISFKKFGVSLTFTPVVLSEGRISLKVMTEVSDLSTDNAITLQAAPGLPTLTVPSIRARRADTTVEIPSGGALAMAGMIQDQTKQQINGIPGLMQLPVLGTLFRSRDFINRQSELMVLVTPYIVRAVAQKDLSRPDDGFADASDPASSLIGRLSNIYGVSGRGAERRGSYRGNYGFILD